MLNCHTTDGRKTGSLTTVIEIVNGKIIPPHESDRVEREAGGISVPQREYQILIIFKSQWLEACCMQMNKSVLWDYKGHLVLHLMVHLIHRLSLQLRQCKPRGTTVLRGHLTRDYQDIPEMGPQNIP